MSSPLDCARFCGEWESENPALLGGELERLPSELIEPLLPEAGVWGKLSHNHKHSDTILQSTFKDVS